ncbi:MAG: hypothetical protein RMI94_04405 [Bryobacterales bacterium]|nr:hypothetical protein [Bryobacteraceae bacterium]MDW8129766.1 hypothetical protein [Bryobacterales bacterium]
MSLSRVAILIGILAGLAPATTLEKLSLEEMAARATAIVRGRVTASWCAQRGPLIYTHYRVQVTERWKGPEAAVIEVVVPGGTVGGVRQSFTGTPKLGQGAEYVLFLWRGPSGLTHILGFTQGVFDLTRDSSGELVAARAAAPEVLLEPASGRPVSDVPLRLKLDDLSRRIRSALATPAR